MKRPTGVTVLAIINFLEGFVFLLLAGALWLVAWAMGQGELAGASADLSSGSAEVLEALEWLGARGLLSALVAGVAVFGGLYLALGVGLWRLKDWARVTMVILTGARVPIVLWGLTASLLDREPASLVLDALIVFVYVWIVWYLFQPPVKQTFGAG
jgi:hypothetical protein